MDSTQDQLINSYTDNSHSLPSRTHQYVFDTYPYHRTVALQRLCLGITVYDVVN